MTDWNRFIVAECTALKIPEMHRSAVIHRFEEASEHLPIQDDKALRELAIRICSQAARDYQAGVLERYLEGPKPTMRAPQPAKKPPPPGRDGKRRR